MRKIFLTRKLTQHLSPSEESKISDIDTVIIPVTRPTQPLDRAPIPSTQFLIWKCVRRFYIERGHGPTACVMSDFRLRDITSQGFHISHFYSGGFYVTLCAKPGLMGDDMYCTYVRNTEELDPI